MEVTHECVKIY